MLLDVVAAPRDRSVGPPHGRVAPERLPLAHLRRRARALHALCVSGVEHARDARRREARARACAEGAEQVAGEGRAERGVDSGERANHDAH